MDNSEVKLMTAKVNDELLKIAEATEPQQEIPVIVTITADANLTALKQKGLKIQHSFKNISAVSGTLPAAEINALSQLDEVERIEYDSKAWALEREKE
jgi:hypothetical protein